MGNAVDMPKLSQATNPANDTTNVYFTIDWGKKLLAQKTLIVKELTADAALLGTPIDFVKNSNYDNSENGTQNIVLCADFPAGVTATVSNSLIGYDRDRTYCYVKHTSLQSGKTYSITAALVQRGLVQSTSTPPIIFGYSPGQGASPTVQYIYCDANKSELTVYYSKPSDADNRKSYANSDIPAGSILKEYVLTTGSGTSFLSDGTRLSSGVKTTENLLVNATFSLSEALPAKSILYTSTGVLSFKNDSAVAAPSGSIDVAGLFSFTLPSLDFPSTRDSLYFGLTAKYTNATAASGKKPTLSTEWSKTNAYSTPISFVVRPVIVSGTLKSSTPTSTLATPIDGASNIFQGSYKLAFTGKSGSSNLIDGSGGVSNVPSDRTVLKWAYYDDYNASLNSTSQTSVTWGTISNGAVTTTGLTQSISFSGNYNIDLQPQSAWESGRYITIQLSFGTTGNYSTPEYVTLFYQGVPTLAQNTAVTVNYSAQYKKYFLQMTPAISSFGLGTTSHDLNLSLTSAKTTQTSVKTAISTINTESTSKPSTYSTPLPGWVSTFDSQWTTINAGIPNGSDERSTILYSCFVLAASAAHLLSASDSTINTFTQLNSSMVALINTLTPQQLLDTDLKASLTAARDAYNVSNLASYKLALLMFVYYSIVSFNKCNSTYFTKYVDNAVTNWTTKYNRAVALETVLDANIILNYTVNGEADSKTVKVKYNELESLFNGNYALQPPSGMNWSAGGSISTGGRILANCKVNTYEPSQYSDVANQEDLISPYVSDNTTAIASATITTVINSASIPAVSNLSPPVLSVVKTSNNSVKYTFKPDSANNVNTYLVKYSINNSLQPTIHTITNSNTDKWEVTVTSGPGTDPAPTLAGTHSVYDSTSTVDSYKNSATHYIGGAFVLGDLITVSVVAHKNSTTVNGVTTPEDNSDASILNVVPSTQASISSIAISTASVILNETIQNNEATYLDDIITITVNNNGQALKSFNLLNIYEDSNSDTSPVNDPYANVVLNTQKDSNGEYVSNIYTGGLKNIANVIDINTVEFVRISESLDEFTKILSVKAAGSTQRFGARVPTQTVIVVRCSTTSMKQNATTPTSPIITNGLIGIYANLQFSQNTSLSNSAYKLQQK